MALGENAFLAPVRYHRLKVYRMLQKNGVSLKGYILKANREILIQNSFQRITSYDLCGILDTCQRSTSVLEHPV